MDEHELVVVPPLKDRSVGLILFGALEIVIGCLCALMVPMMVFATLAGQAGHAPVDAKTIVPAILIYAMVAAVFICLGIGSIRMRRWAWALMLVLSWMWLVCGVMGMIFFVLVMPNLFAEIGGDQKIPPQAILVIQIVTGAIAGCLYLLLPGMFILFYQSKHVKATCEFRDPRVRWTDRCPLPVLAVTLFLAFSACSPIWSVGYGCLFPLFGTLLSGIPGGLAWLAFSVLTALLAWGTYKLKPLAWWGVIALWIVLPASSIITFSRVDLMEMYQKMGLPQEQLDMMRRTGIIEMSFHPLWIGSFVILMIGYMIYVKRYFSPSRSETK